MRATLLALLASGCGGGAAAVPVGAQLGPALAAAMTAADHARAPWRCAAADGPALAAETITVGAHAWKLEGHAMSRASAGDVVIGAIADAGGAAPATLEVIGRLRTKLAKADVVLALGGMGTTKAELEATLGALADHATFPVVALPGDLEGIGVLQAAIGAMRARGQVVIDGRLAQRIELGMTTIATIAGTSAPGRLVAGDDGCTYLPADVAAALAELTARKGVRVLASHEAPRGERAGEPTGDLAITAGAGHEVDVALHGPMSEVATRARAGGRDGDAVAITPGTVDAAPRLPEAARTATAGLLVIRGDAWSWKPVTDTE